MAYRQFEVRGYDKMIERILEQPIKSSIASQNHELEEKLMLIKDSLNEQVHKGNQYQQMRDQEEVKRTDADAEESGEESSYYDDEEDEEEEDEKKETVEEEVKEKSEL